MKVNWGRKLKKKKRPAKIRLAKYYKNILIKKNWGKKNIKRKNERIESICGVQAPIPTHAVNPVPMPDFSSTGQNTYLSLTPPPMYDHSPNVWAHSYNHNVILKIIESVMRMYVFLSDSCLSELTDRTDWTLTLSPKKMPKILGPVRMSRFRILCKWAKSLSRRSWKTPRTPQRMRWKSRQTKITVCFLQNIVKTELSRVCLFVLIKKN